MCYSQENDFKCSNFLVSKTLNLKLKGNSENTNLYLNVVI